MGILVPDVAAYLYVTGLQNAHAMEAQSLRLLERQTGRFAAEFPELDARLREHHDQSLRQRARLGESLARQGNTASRWKDVTLGAGGDLAAFGQRAAGDELLKTTLSLHMFENFELGVYESLIAMADYLGDAPGVTAARDSLREEQAMAVWLRDNLGQITARFMALTAASESFLRPGRAPSGLLSARRMQQEHLAPWRPGGEPAGQEYHPAPARPHMAQQLEAERFSQRRQDSVAETSLRRTPHPVAVEPDRPEMEGQVDTDFAEYEPADRYEHTELARENIEQE